ncbi:MAG: hypothetical protein ISS90_02270 [Candidatus Omnitrophica bacterium]|nr:hypothetical protein [Candidatus Omnitrophota bacterium]
MRKFSLALIFILCISLGVSAEEVEPSGKTDASVEPPAETVFIYNNRGRRDPFVPLVGDTSGVVGSLEDVMSIEDVELNGLASTSTGEKIAILNGEMVKEGQSVGRLTLKKVLDAKVIILIDDVEYELNIQEEIAQ